MYAAVGVIGLAGYFISNKFNTSVKDSQSLEEVKSTLSLKRQIQSWLFQV